MTVRGFKVEQEDVELIEKEEALKPRCWWEWSCYLHLQNGDFVEGIIESDGDLHDLETFRET